MVKHIHLEDMQNSNTLYAKTVEKKKRVKMLFTQMTEKYCVMDVMESF